MRVTIGGKIWRLDDRAQIKGDGDCEGPHVKNKRIRINAKLKGRKRLETILHELLHARFWDLAEEPVHNAAHDFSVILERLGYTDD